MLLRFAHRLEDELLDEGPIFLTSMLVSALGLAGFQVYFSVYTVNGSQPMFVNFVGQACLAIGLGAFAVIVASMVLLILLMPVIWLDDRREERKRAQERQCHLDEVRRRLA